MPVHKLKTVSSEKVWSSPDGKRTIYQLEMINTEGQSLVAKTYSNAVAQVGWSGDAETYDKEGRNGVETFIKQPQREDGQRSYGGSKPSNDKNDNFTMYLSYAKDIAVALIGVKAYTAERLAGIVNDVAIAGEQLFDAHNGETQKPDVVHEVTEAPLDTTLIDKVFNNQEQETEDPWGKN